MSVFDKNEKRWISRAKRLLREKPETIKMYHTDDGIVVCKVGLKTYELIEKIGNPGMIDSGIFASDMHDVF